MVLETHLFRKVDKVLVLNFVYELVENKYCLDNEIPSINPFSLVQNLLTQRLLA